MHLLSSLFGAILVSQLCFAQNPIENYLVKNAAEDRISHDQRIQGRLEDRKQHDARVLAQIQQDTVARGGSLQGDAELQSNLQSRIESDTQVQKLLNDRIAHDQRLISQVSDQKVSYPAQTAQIAVPQVKAAVGQQNIYYQPGQQVFGTQYKSAVDSKAYYPYQTTQQYAAVPQVKAAVGQQSIYYQPGQVVGTQYKSAVDSKVYYPYQTAQVGVAQVKSVDQKAYAAYPYQTNQYQTSQYYHGVAIPIISYVNDINPDGSYKYGYTTGNGISAQEEGVLKEYAKAIDSHGQQIVEPSQFVTGNYAYTSPEGIPVSVSYTADENGFHAKTYLAYQSENQAHGKLHLHAQPYSQLQYQQVQYQQQPQVQYQQVPQVQYKEQQVQFQPQQGVAAAPVEGLEIDPKLGTPLVIKS